MKEALYGSGSEGAVTVVETGFRLGDGRFFEFLCCEPEVGTSPSERSAQSRRPSRPFSEIFPTDCSIFDPHDPFREATLEKYTSSASLSKLANAAA